MHEQDAATELWRLRRFIGAASAVGLVLAYALCFPLKHFDLLPEHMTWLGIGVGPLAVFGSLAWLAWGPVLLPRWPPKVAQLPGLLVAIALMILVRWERGWR